MTEIHEVMERIERIKSNLAEVEVRVKVAKVLELFKEVERLYDVVLKAQDMLLAIQLDLDRILAELEDIVNPDELPDLPEDSENNT